MDHRIPAPIRMAAADVKSASTATLTDALDFVDYIEADTFEAISDEHARRTDPEWAPYL